MPARREIHRSRHAARRVVALFLLAPLFAFAAAPPPPASSVATPTAPDPIPTPTGTPVTDHPPGSEALTALPPAPALNSSAFSAPLFPGQRLQPIDLAAALRLAGARHLDIATARQRLFQSVAELEQARALWLPSLFIGPTWYRADGQIQTVTGQVQAIDRSSLFLGGTAAMANGFPAPSPGTGFPALNGLSSVLRISDAIYEPRAAQRVAAANRAGIQVATNDSLLAVAESYFDLLRASGELAIAGEAAGNAGQLSEITGSYARTGQGLEADHRRALTELRRRRKEIQLAAGRLKITSAVLVQALVLDPYLVVAPVEPAEMVVRLVPDGVPIEDLIAQGLRNRPEMAQAQETVSATLMRLKQARLRPFVPSVAITFAGGGFGGGANGFFGNFGSRGDTAASLFWDLRNLGFTDRAIVNRRTAEKRTADIDLTRVQARVMADVVTSMEARAAAMGQMAEAKPAVSEAVESLRLNMINIRQGALLREATRPIEVLQPIQALAQARLDYLDAVLTYNRAQFRLYYALGNPPLLPPGATANTSSAPVLPPRNRDGREPSRAGG
jgi:outer membrane protein TolC